MIKALFNIALSLAASSVAAANLEITVSDAKGAPVADAVVYARPLGVPLPLRKRDAAVEQRNKAFVPLVSVVQVGTPVLFPNLDAIRHHVYSFSPVKTFEIKLYAGTPVAPIVFDKAGEVVLGCNIHDNMIAYIYVVDTPHFGKTDGAGKARLADLPGGEFELQLVHFAQLAPQPARAIKLRADETQAAAFSVPLKVVPPRPAPQ